MIQVIKCLLIKILQYCVISQFPSSKPTPLDNLVLHARPKNKGTTQNNAL